jgi:hypothetical protein
LFAKHDERKYVLAQIAEAVGQILAQYTSG